MLERVLAPYNVPFYTQRTTDFRAEGYFSEEEALYWQPRGCGIASLRMIIDGIRTSQGKNCVEPQGTMIYKGLERHAYVEELGWIHRGLVDLAKDYDIEGESHRKASVEDVIQAINHGMLCMASVSVLFNQEKRGGHLIVVKGYETENGKVCNLIVNHPSSNEKYNWENYSVSLEHFRNSFSGAFMSFSAIKQQQ